MEETPEAEQSPSKEFISPELPVVRVMGGM